MAEKKAATVGRECNIGGCTIYFPFEPYKAQLAFMERMIEALQRGHNALLESPTGTGKTLCLLCAALGWRQVHAACIQAHRGGFLASEFGQDIQQKLLEGASGGAALVLTDMGQPEKGLCKRIVYMSRTHGQIGQVIRELRNTAYKPKTALLGSRQQLCIHKDVSKLRGGAQNSACQKLVAANGCSFYPKVQNHKYEKPEVFDALDIEDLCKHGEVHHVCPYYLSRNMCDDAELVFMPYNYLTDPMSRKSLRSLWPDSVIIFDEAHNLGSICAESASFDITASVVAQSIAEVSRCLSQLDAGRDVAGLLEAPASREELLVLKSLLKEFETVVDGLELRGDPPEMTRDGNFILQIFDWAGINRQNAGVLCEMLDKTVNMLTAAQGPAATTTPALKTFNDAVQIVFRTSVRGGEEESLSLYKVHVYEEKPVSKKAAQEARTNLAAPAVIPTTSKGRCVGYWCFSAGVTMREIVNEGVRNIILASGTLSPMDSWSVEMQVPFHVMLENEHVIKEDQLFAVCLPKGPTGITLNSSFKSRERPEYKAELGNVICNVARVVPGGVLVFFPSYSVLSDCTETWQAGSVWDRINRIKAVFVEPRDSSQFKDTVTKFTDHVDENPTSGAVLMAVCRGKMSEGIDFADRHGRAVIVTGIPFPAYLDARVRLKRLWLDAEARATKGTLTGDKWYNQQASRAVNQAIGRVIRHKDDFGVILLCDERFASWGANKLLSKWVAPQLTKIESFGPLVQGLTAFFKSHKPPSTLPRQRIAYQPSAERFGSEDGAEAAEARDSNKARKVDESGRRVMTTSVDFADQYRQMPPRGAGSWSEETPRGGLLTQLEESSSASASKEDSLQTLNGGGSGLLAQLGASSSSSSQSGAGGSSAVVGLRALMAEQPAQSMSDKLISRHNGARQADSGVRPATPSAARPTSGAGCIQAPSAASAVSGGGSSLTRQSSAPGQSGTVRPPGGAMSIVSILTNSAAREAKTLPARIPSSSGSGTGPRDPMSAGKIAEVENDCAIKGRAANGSMEKFLLSAKSRLGDAEYSQFKDVMKSIKQAKDVIKGVNQQAQHAEKEGVYERLHNLFGRPDREDLLRELCGYLGRDVLRELREFVAKRHPSSLKNIPLKKDKSNP